MHIGNVIVLPTDSEINKEKIEIKLSPSNLKSKVDFKILKLLNFIASIKHNSIRLACD